MTGRPATAGNRLSSFWHRATAIGFCLGTLTLAIVLIAGDRVWTWWQVLIAIGSLLLAMLMGFASWSLAKTERLDTERPLLGSAVQNAEVPARLPRLLRLRLSIPRALRPASSRRSPVHQAIDDADKFAGRRVKGANHRRRCAPTGVGEGRPVAPARTPAGVSASRARPRDRPAVR